jgi:CheY-like chemotaxis protein
MNRQATPTPMYLGKAGGIMTQAIPLVLLVEDDTHSMYLMERYTRNTGCRSIGAASGEKALAVARQERPAVIFLDLMLPGMGGWQVLRELKADPLTRHIPIIICSALNEADHALELGASCLHKPIYYQDFVTALKNAGVKPPTA